MTLRRGDTPDPMEARDLEARHPRPGGDRRSPERSARCRAAAVAFTSGTGGFAVRESLGRVTELACSTELPNVFYEGNIKGVEGGDRMWIAPELDLFYDDSSEPETWRCPPEIDPGSWSMEKTDIGVQLEQSVFETEMIRTIEPITTFPSAEKEGLPWSGYRVTNQLITGKPWTPWHLLMLPTEANIFIKNAADHPVVYYPPLPKISKGWMYANGEPPRWKVGFNPPRDSSCVIGVLSREDPGCMLLVTAQLPPNGTYVDRPPKGKRAAPIQVFDSMGEGFCEVELHAPLESRVVSSTVLAIWGDRTARLRLLESISKSGSC